MISSSPLVEAQAQALACAALSMARENRHSQALWAGLLLGPSVVGWGLWQLYLHVARIGPDLAFRPVASWDWLAPVAVLRAFFIDRLRGNPLSGGAALLIASVALVLCAILWRRLPREDASRHAPARTLLVIVSVVSGCFMLFLAVSYVGFFSRAEVAQAASAWRYLTELGPLLLTGMAAVLASFWPKRRWPAVAGALGLLAAVMTLSLPVLGREHYALDCRYPDMIAARLLTAELAPKLAPLAPNSDRQRRLAVVHPTMGDWMAHAMAYDLRWPVIGRSIAYRTTAGDGKSAEQWAWDAGADALLDLTALDGRTLAESGVIPAVALVARPAGRDASWTTLAASPAQPLPRCAGP